MELVTSLLRDALRVTRSTKSTSRAEGVQLVRLPAARAPPPGPARNHGGAGRARLQTEATEIHTGILRLALGVEDSRSYWEQVDRSIPSADRALMAFEQRWFGSKSLPRVKFLVANFVARYDPFPEALATLHRWRGMDVTTRDLICHWHLQLSDPLYRRFTGEFLVEQRGLRVPKVDRDVTLRWLKSEYPNRWGTATCVQFASKLLSAASEAGLISPRRDPRTFLSPKVSDYALAYLFYLLRGVSFKGTLTENPYLASMALSDAILDQRLRALPGLTYRRMATLTEFDWEYRTLAAWAEASLQVFQQVRLEEATL
jgi:hypothetical protein